MQQYLFLSDSNVLSIAATITILMFSQKDMRKSSPKLTKMLYCNLITSFSSKTDIDRRKSSSMRFQKDSLKELMHEYVKAPAFKMSKSPPQNFKVRYEFFSMRISNP